MAQKVVPLEIHLLSDPVLDAVGVLEDVEVLPEKWCWHVSYFVGSVRPASSCLLEADHIDVARHYSVFGEGGELIQDNGQGIGLTAHRAPRAPDVQPRPVHEQQRQNLGLELFKGQRVTEELADFDGQETTQALEHGPIALNHTAVGNNAGR